MRIFVTGASGFAGRHLVAELQRHVHKVIPFDLAPSDLSGAIQGDLLDAAGLESTVAEVAPDACIHLAGIAFVPSGGSHPGKMFSVNLLGTINLLEAFRKGSPESRVLVVSSAHVYGNLEGPRPFQEDDPLRPTTLYATSKSAADTTSLAYAREHSMHVMTARPTNHTGPGQEPCFVVPSFVNQVRAIADGASPVVHVGNLDSKRHFVDVRDVVRAYRLITENGKQGNAYNISSEHIVSIGSVLDTICDMAGVQPERVMDPDKYRPTDSSPSLDMSRISSELGWQTEIDMSTTLKDMLEGIGA